MEFRGLHDDNEENIEQRYFEFGAHFRYKDLVEALKYLQGSQLSKKEKDKENSINIKNNSNYNEVYNQINKQLCQKMTDIIPPNKFIQSRNIKPLIQSLSQKLTDIIQSQNNKKPMRHYVTKKKQINSKNKNLNNNHNTNNNNLMNKNIAKTNLENTKKNDKIILNVKQPYKKKEISQSRNMAEHKKPLLKNNVKNAQLNLNTKKNNLIPQDARHFTNTNIHNKINQPADKNLNNANKNNNITNKNNEKIYGTVIEENKKMNNNNNNQNTQTVQNIIVKSNINISFINNYNTTYLTKSKKKQKKIRSRNNQELIKLNMVENKIININNNIKVEEENNNSKIYRNKIIENNTNSKNKNKITANTNKEIRKKTPLISPKLKNKESANSGNLKKKIIINNQNTKNKQNIINNQTKKEKQEKGNNNIINKKRISLGNNNIKSDNNKKLVNNYIGRVKIHI